MKLHSFEDRLLRLPALALVCLALTGRLCADEAPGNNQNPPPAPVELDITPLQGVIYAHDLSNTRLALDALYVATNTDWIGAEVAQVDDVLRSHLGLAEGKGLVVTSLVEGGPAAKAGVQKYDVLVTVGGEEIAGVEALRKSLEDSADKAIALGLIRGGKKQSVEVIPRSTAPVAHVVNELALETRFWLGVGLAPADESLRSQLGISAGEALVVTSVENDSPAAKAGVMVNDVLLKLDGKALTTAEALNEQLQTIADKSASLELLRHGKPAMLTVTPEKHAVSQGMVNWLDLNNANYGNVYIHDGHPYWTVNNGRFWDLATNNPYFVGVQYPGLALTQGQGDIVQRLNDVEAQLKHLEVALAALRSAIETTTKPTPSSDDKK